jgi:FAD/FMN-containing dehydrogenase
VATHSLADALQHLVKGAGAYVNFMTEEETDRVAAAYGANYTRLVALKRRYDPDNVFHVNQNIKP